MKLALASVFAAQVATPVGQHVPVHTPVGEGQRRYKRQGVHSNNHNSENIENRTDYIEALCMVFKFISLGPYYI